MNPRMSMNIMLALSVLYGAAVAIMAFVDTSALGTFTVVGAIVLGALWAVRGFVSRGASSSS